MFHVNNNYINKMVVQKNGLRKEKDDGERNSRGHDAAYGGGCVCEDVLMDLSELILRAMIEALRIDGKKAEVVNQ